MAGVWAAIWGAGTGAGAGVGAIAGGAAATRGGVSTGAAASGAANAGGAAAPANVATPGGGLSWTDWLAREPGSSGPESAVATGGSGGAARTTGATGATGTAGTTGAAARERSMAPRFTSTAGLPTPPITTCARAEVAVSAATHVTHNRSARRESGREAVIGLAGATWGGKPAFMRCDSKRDNPPKRPGTLTQAPSAANPIALIPRQFGP